MSATTTSSTKRELAIFWDYENVVIPPRFTNPVEVSNAIVGAVSHYGRIVDRRMYMDFTRRRTKDVSLWAALDSSGFDLVDTPARNGIKETLDKKLIVDVLTFAWDSAVRNDNVKPVVVLLTSDGDYAYTLQKLRDRGVMAVVIYASDAAVASTLKAAADTALHFETEVLSTVRNGSNPSSSLASSGSPKLRHKSSVECVDEDARVLAQVILPLMSKDKAIISKQEGDGETIKWVISANAASQFRSELSRQSSQPPKNMKERYQAARKFAVTNRWIVQGRRKLTLPGTPIVVLPDDFTQGKTKNDYSLEDFMSVTDKGSGILALGASVTLPRTPSTRSDSQGSSKITSDDPDTFLFLKNISKPASAKSLARHIEQSVPDVTVIRLMTRLSSANPNSPFCFAKVQVGSASEALRVMEKGVSWRNRGVMITVDHGGSSGFMKSKGDYYYETRAENSTPNKSFGDSNGSCAKESGKRDNHKAATYLYLKNVAKPVSAQELARHIEQSLLGVTILRAVIPPGGDKWFNPFCFAKIQVESVAQAQIALEQSEKLSWRGRLITISPDKAGNKGYADIGPDGYYERQTSTSPSSEAKITGQSEIFSDASFERLASSITGENEAAGIIAIPDSPFNRLTLSRNGDMVDGMIPDSPFEPLPSSANGEKNGAMVPSDILSGGSFESITPTSIMDDASSILFSDANAAAFYEDLIRDHDQEDTDRKPFYQGNGVDVSGEINISTNSAFVSNESKAEEKEEQESAGDAFLFLKNVAKPVVASDLAKHIENSSNGVTVLRAAIRPGPDPSFAFCFAKIQMETNLQAKALLEQSGILEWQGRALTILPDKQGPKGYEDPFCLSSYKNDIFKEDLEETNDDKVGEDIEILVRAAELMTGQGKHQDGWIDGGAFRTHAPQYFTPERFKEARAMACVKGFLEIGRRHKLYGNIVVFDRTQFVGPQYSPNIYVRRTQKAIA
mmetsp:Transcript_24673/g.46933  ORF Transcript_24673/g.46933 Transcript_24673/m.46933 type:complete len:963 (-) Transcript_24673:59-2947(-)|eukprot:scaffold1953_cov176-Amphora_coffeaeformis.AAC.38